ncbi:KAT3-like protein [Mya arenaria]|uniref:kynurenine--oxoglutarate transaminase n=1 Tax=Mya arenaria TaxID=6604 RepID=A0ABY7GAJ0_MYAAR|nr:KAT3-like protein [Mya arenaria]
MDRRFMALIFLIFQCAAYGTYMSSCERYNFEDTVLNDLREIKNTIRGISSPTTPPTPPPTCPSEWRKFGNSCYLFNTTRMSFVNAEPSIHPSSHPSIHPSIHLAIHPSIHPSIHPNWAPNEPNGATESCGCLKFFTGYHWNDINCAIFSIWEQSLTSKFGVTLEEHATKRLLSPADKPKQGHLSVVLWSSGDRKYLIIFSFIQEEGRKTELHNNSELIINFTRVYQINLVILEFGHQSTEILFGHQISSVIFTEVPVAIKKNVKQDSVEFGKLSAEYKAINLGQGFPDYHPPQHVLDIFAKLVQGDNPLVHQYTRSYGHPHLVNVLAKLYGPIMGRQIDPMTEVTVSIGAFGILFSCMQGLVNPGDEVIIIEPFFDCYEPMVRVAGGKPVFVPLRPTKTEGEMTSHDWQLNTEEITKAFNKNTKAIILNNPNNPVGKVFRREELEVIAKLCIEHDVVCVADEVYEWMIYRGFEHIKIGSAGKTFSATGWKLGWAVGPADLMQALMVLHQNSIYTCPTPIQEAVAAGLEYELSVFGDEEKCYLKSLALQELAPKRDMLAKVLSEVGMTPTVPEGGYFMLADISKLRGFYFGSRRESPEGMEGRTRQ